jgi:hypothetical protein
LLIFDVFNVVVGPLFGGKKDHPGVTPPYRVVPI